MKVTVNIDCSPQEARSFFGLPDVEPLNDQLVAEMSRRMSENMELMEPEALMRHWMQVGGRMSDQFMDLMNQAASGGGSSNKT